jgi:hypothetical protein
MRLAVPSHEFRSKEDLMSRRALSQLLLFVVVLVHTASLAGRSPDPASHVTVTVRAVSPELAPQVIDYVRRVRLCGDPRLVFTTQSSPLTALVEFTESPGPGGHAVDCLADERQRLRAQLDDATEKVSTRVLHTSRTDRLLQKLAAFPMLELTETEVIIDLATQYELVNADIDRAQVLYEDELPMRFAVAASPELRTYLSLRPRRFERLTNERETGTLAKYGDAMGIWLLREWNRTTRASRTLHLRYRPEFSRLVTD